MPTAKAIEIELWRPVHTPMPQRCTSQHRDTFSQAVEGRRILLGYYGILNKTGRENLYIIGVESEQLKHGNDPANPGRLKHVLSQVPSLEDPHLEVILDPQKSPIAPSWGLQALSSFRPVTPLSDGCGNACFHCCTFAPVITAHRPLPEILILEKTPPFAHASIYQDNEPSQYRDTVLGAGIGNYLALTNAHPTLIMHEIDPDDPFLIESARHAADNLPSKGIVLHSFHFMHRDILTTDGQINSSAFARHARRMETLLDTFKGKFARVIVFDAIDGVVPEAVNDPLTLLARSYAREIQGRYPDFFNFGNLVFPWRSRDPRYFHSHYPALANASFDLPCAEELILKANGSLCFEYWSGRDASGSISINARVKFRQLVPSAKDERFLPTLAAIQGNTLCSPIGELWGGKELALRAGRAKNMLSAEAANLYDDVAEIPVSFYAIKTTNPGLAESFAPIFMEYHRDVSVLPWRLYNWPVAKVA